MGEVAGRLNSYDSFCIGHALTTKGEASTGLLCDRSCLSLLMYYAQGQLSDYDIKAAANFASIVALLSPSRRQLVLNFVVQGSLVVYEGYHFSILSQLHC